MSDRISSDEARLIADLNDLLQLDHDAVQAYTIAIDLARDAKIRDQLVEFRSDHKRHIDELAGEVRDRGGLPTELPHPTSPLKGAVQALGAVASDTTLLLAFKAVEGQGRDKYRRASEARYPGNAGTIISRGAADEDRHYRWVEEQLRARGAGEGSLPHGVAQVVEGVHKAIADPIERVEREVMRTVGEAVGTTRTRGGSEAPSPIDVANGMAANSGDRTPDLDPDRSTEPRKSRIIDPFSDDFRKGDV